MRGATNGRRTGMAVPVAQHLFANSTAALKGYRVAMGRGAMRPPQVFAARSAARGKASHDRRDLSDNLSVNSVLQ